MKSPFPGMDPYLERHWRDVHHRIITYASDQLQPLLPEDLRIRVEERVFLEAPESEARGFYPDLHVVGRRDAPQAGEPGGAPVGGMRAPLVLQLPQEPANQGYLEIVDAAGGRKVITVIEFLSPSNKLPGEGQGLFLEKQRELWAARVSQVEIDLTRAGRRVMMVPPERIPPSHRTTYQACVRRRWKPFAVEIYPLPLRERLPAIGVPLRERDADVPLDLQALLDLIYANGRYGSELDYKGGPLPPLDPEDAAWADELLRCAGRR